MRIISYILIAQYVTFEYVTIYQDDILTVEGSSSSSVYMRDKNGTLHIIPTGIFDQIFKPYEREYWSTPLYKAVNS